MEDGAYERRNPILFGERSATSSKLVLKRDRELGGSLFPLTSINKGREERRPRGRTSSKRVKMGRDQPLLGGVLG